MVRSRHFSGPAEKLLEGFPPDAEPWEVAAFQLIVSWLRGADTFSFATSGSTGTPKRISFNRSQLEASARLTREALQLRHGETALCCLDTQLIAGAMMVIRALSTNMHLVLVQPGPQPFRGVKETIDFAAIVPYQLDNILHECPERLHTTTKYIIGGAPLSQKQLSAIRSLSSPLFATYGMTETITHIALMPLNGPAASDQFELLPGIVGTTNDRGCLVIRAPHLSEPIITNDLVEMSDPTHFRWMGRADRVINSGGIKIHPDLLEQKIASIVAGFHIDNRLVVVGLSDSAFGEVPVLVIEGQITQLTEEKLLERMRIDLGGKHAPRRVVTLEKFPETPSQKPDRLEIVRRLSS